MFAMNKTARECEDRILVTIVVFDDNEKDRVGVQLDHLFHAETRAVRRQMLGAERPKHIACERIFAIGTNLLAHKLDDESARTFFSVGGLFSDK